MNALRSLLVPVLIVTSGLCAPRALALQGDSAADDATITASARDIVRMQNAGVEKPVIQAYILSAKTPYKATADDILYLHQTKVPDDLIAEWVRKGGELMGAPSTAAHSPNLAPATQQAPVVTPGPEQAAPPAVVYQNPPTTVATQPQVVYTSPTYSYAYSDPYYYGYYGYPAVSIGFGWGWPYYGYYGGHYYSCYNGHYYYHGGHDGYHGYGGGHYNGGHYNGGHYNSGHYMTGGSGGHYGGSTVHASYAGGHSMGGFSGGHGGGGGFHGGGGGHGGGGHGR